MEKEAGEASRTTLLTQAERKRVIAVHARELAAQLANRIDRLAFIDRAEELEREAALLEAKAAKLLG